MPNGNTIILARNAVEAAAIIKSPLAREHQILSLWPEAAAAFKCHDLDVTDTTTLYSDISHIRTLINTENIERQFKAMAHDLSDIQIEHVRIKLFYITATASFFYQILKNFEIFYLYKDGELLKFEGFENVFKIIMQQILEHKYRAREYEFSGLHLWLMKPIMLISAAGTESARSY